MNLNRKGRDHHGDAALTQLNSTFACWEVNGGGYPSYCELSFVTLVHFLCSETLIPSSGETLNHLYPLSRHIHDGGLRYRYVRTARLHR